MLVDPAFVQLTEVGFREDGAAFGLVHSGAEQVFHIMNRNNHRRAGCVKGTEQIFTAAAHSALAVAALDIEWCCASRGLWCAGTCRDANWWK